MTAPEGPAVTAGPRIGSLCTGTGMLDLAVMDVYGGTVAWHCQYDPDDKRQYAAQILARHWPDVPNHGDITAVDFAAVEPIDILIAGFPCQDVSSAGLRAGIAEGTRSGLWLHVARAIAVLRPKLVVIENVEGLLSAPAASDVEPCPHCVGDGSAEPPLRALGAVLGDLASLGFDAEWARVAASEVGAPHGRKRVFIRAWPVAADPTDLGHERGWGARGRGDGPADGGVAAAHTCGVDAERRGVAGVLGGPPSAEPGEGDQRERAGHPAGHRGEAAADADGRGREGHPQRHRGPDAGQPEHQPGMDPVGRGVQRGPAPDADRGGLGPDQRDVCAGQPDTAWGHYEPAIRRWEHILGRTAPRPTDALGRLSAEFTEWLMGLPAGWVTDTPGLTRPAMLKALGNGVVRLQASTAIRLLHERVADELAALAAA